ncbi:MAG TPA: GntR family transcriptional regulator [Conexibacter sp.]|jgi:GntR family transcriptional regulator
MFNELENTPLADRARDAILEAILEQRFDGDRLPSEDELGKMLNVSRTTIRTALQSLEQDGIITRRRAIGTTINRHIGPPTLALQRLIGFDRLLKEKGHRVTVEQSWRRESPPPEMTEIFEIPADMESFVTEKVYSADGERAIFVRDLVPWELIVREMPDSPAASLFEFSKRYLAHPIDHAVAEIVPVVKQDSGTTPLDVDAGQAFIRLHEVHYSLDGQRLAYSTIDIDDAFARFEVFRRQ